MDSKNILILGAVGVGGYLAYNWYYGSGGYADQQACAAGGAAAGANSIAATAVAIWKAAAANKYTSALDFIAKAKSDPSITSLAGWQAAISCWRVAVTQYPSLALAEAAAGTAVTTGTTATTGTTVATPAAPVAPVQVGLQVASAAPSSLDAMYATLKNQAASDAFFTGSGDSLTASVDHWNYYLAQLVPAGVTIPAGLFSNVAGDDPNNLTAAQYWAVMAPWLRSNAGLSGLGIYGGLGALVRAHRGR
jgi:hypothetical protein